jgi:hypothetical protein
MSTLSSLGDIGCVTLIRPAAPRACQSILAAACVGLLLSANHASAQTWTLTSAPITNWSSVASSADGSKLVAAVDGGLVYTSTNSGSTWAATAAPATNWTRVTSSADGTKLVAMSPSALYASSDSGINWTNTSFGASWLSLAASADGGTVAAIVAGATLVSTNSGITWADVGPLGPFDLWRRLVACSASGGVVAIGGQFAGSGSGFVEFWMNTGTTNYWDTSNRLLPNYLQSAGQCAAIAFSADAMNVSVLFNDPSSITCPGKLYSSRDSGVTWVTNCAPATNWTSLACSADGIRLVAASFGDAFYTSTNAGTTWTASTVPAGEWCSVASSADGNKLIAATAGGGIYTWQSTPAPALIITGSGTNVVLSWTVPSATFALQTKSGVDTTNWIDVPRMPACDYSTLRDEVTIPAQGSTMLYRLSSR